MIYTAAWHHCLCVCFRCVLWDDVAAERAGTAEQSECSDDTHHGCELPQHLVYSHHEGSQLTVRQRKLYHQELGSLEKEPYWLWVRHTIPRWRCSGRKEAGLGEWACPIRAPTSLAFEGWREVPGAELSGQPVKACTWLDHHTEGKQKIHG